MSVLRRLDGAPSMNRRWFLRSLGLATVAGALDPERWLWEPGKKVVFDLWTPKPRPIAICDTKLGSSIRFSHAWEMYFLSPWGRCAGNRSWARADGTAVEQYLSSKRYLSSGGRRAVAGRGHTRA